MVAGCERPQHREMLAEPQLGTTTAKKKKNPQRIAQGPQRTFLSWGSRAPHVTCRPDVLTAAMLRAVHLLPPLQPWRVWAVSELAKAALQAPASSVLDCSIHKDLSESCSTASLPHRAPHMCTSCMCLCLVPEANEGLCHCHHADSEWSGLGNSRVHKLAIIACPHQALNQSSEPLLSWPRHANEHQANGQPPSPPPPPKKLCELGITSRQDSPKNQTPAPRAWSQRTYEHRADGTPQSPQRVDQRNARCCLSACM